MPARQDRQHSRCTNRTGKPHTGHHGHSKKEFNWPHRKEHFEPTPTLITSNQPRIASKVGLLVVVERVELVLHHIFSAKPLEPQFLLEPCVTRYLESYGSRFLKNNLFFFWAVLSCPPRRFQRSGPVTQYFPCGIMHGVKKQLDRT